MAAFSTIDALTSLYTSVPDWNSRLDTLNGKIAERQVELARLEEKREERPTARSLRNRGSTESLRPKDGNENNIPLEETDSFELKPSVQSPKQMQHEPAVRRSAAAAVVTPPLSKPNSTPKASPGAVLTRQLSQPIPPSNPQKPESLASRESMAPKYKTRLMIIVHYDSAVLTTFEELVKFITGSRNAMRKGKMATKMAEMRRAAELEADDDEGEDLLTGLPEVQKKVAGDQAAEVLGRIGATDTDDNGNPSMLRLQYEYAIELDRNKFGRTLSVGLLRGYRKGGDGSLSDIFDELDKRLEWCQSQCEHAAHQFLRDGECSQEIENIKRKLDEVKESAKKEVERLKNEEAEAPPKPVRRLSPEKARAGRKDPGIMDDMEVDKDEDEEVDNTEPPKLIFKGRQPLPNNGYE